MSTPRSSIRFIAAIAVSMTAATALTACASNNDVLKQGPIATASYISDVLERGDAKALCQLESRAQGVQDDCLFVLATKGLGAKPIQEVKTSPLDSNHTQTVFTDPRKGQPGLASSSTDWSFTIEAQPGDSSTTNGIGWAYQFSWGGSERNLSLPYGGTIGDQKLLPQQNYAVMPGEAVGEIMPEQEASGWLETKVDPKTYDVETGISQKGLSEISAKAMPACQAKKGAFKPDLEHFLIDNSFSTSGVQMNVLTPMKIIEDCKITSVEASDFNITATVGFTARMRGQQQAGWLFTYTKSTYTAHVNEVYTWQKDDSGAWPIEAQVESGPIYWHETTP